MVLVGYVQLFSADRVSVEVACYQKVIMFLGSFWIKGGSVLFYFMVPDLIQQGYVPQ